MLTKYDKALAGGIAPAICAVLFWLLTTYAGVTMPPEIQAAVITLITAGLVYTVPNKAGATKAD